MEMTIVTIGDVGIISSMLCSYFGNAQTEKIQTVTHFMILLDVDVKAV